MSLPITLLELRRGVAVGENGVTLGIDRIPGVVFADVRIHEPVSNVWIPPGQALVRVWGGEGPRVWEVVQRSMIAQGISLAVVLEVHPASRWARVRAWWRWQVHRLRRWAE